MNQKHHAPTHPKWCGFKRRSCFGCSRHNLPLNGSVFLTYRDIKNKGELYGLNEFIAVDDCSVQLREPVFREVRLFHLIGEEVVVNEPEYISPSIQNKKTKTS